MEQAITLRLRPAGEDACGVDVPALPGENLARAIWLSGAVAPRPLCLGLGRCGLCRVRYVEEAPPPLPGEEAVLTPVELAAGWRLACHRSVPGAGTLTLELEPTAFAAPASGEPGVETPPTAQAAALGVDLGTTSLQWRAVALGAGPFPGALASGAALNPQAGAGADIMSRLAFARTPEGLAKLGRLARGALAGIVQELAGRGLAPVRICVAANTAMTDIFLGRDVTGLCAAPYRRSHAGGCTVELAGLPPVIIPPLPAPFVGGDLSAGLAAMLERGAPRPFVLADLGTNGELALLTGEDRLFLASVPLGPALEGIGPECGSMAAPGVVTEFRLGATGPLPVLFGEEERAALPVTEARGISATGYLSLLALLFRLGVLDRDGHFSRPEAPSLPLGRRLAALVGAGPGGARLPLGPGLWLSAGDVELLLKVKAAFAVALKALCAQAGVAPTGLRLLALAGALGEHVRLTDLKELGFVPGVPEGRIAAVGNTALAGACLLAAEPGRLPALSALCERATVLELTQAPDFQEAYLTQMRLGE